MELEKRISTLIQGFDGKPDKEIVIGEGIIRNASRLAGAIGSLFTMFSEMNKVSAQVQRLGDKLIQDTKDMADEELKLTEIKLFVAQVRIIVMKSKLPRAVKVGYLQEVERALGK